MTQILGVEKMLLFHTFQQYIRSFISERIDFNNRNKIVILIFGKEFYKKSYYLN